MPPKAVNRKKVKEVSSKPANGKAAGPKKVVQPEGAAPVDAVDGRSIWLATDALQKTKAMRNYSQLERDRIAAFWEVSKKQLEDVRERLRENERNKSLMSERHEIEKKVFEQKIRHLLYENQLQVSTLKEEAERTLMEKEEEFRQAERNNWREVQVVKQLDREMEIRHQEQRMSLIAQQEQEISEQQSEFERELKEIHRRYEQMIKALREEMDLARSEEIRHLEKRKEQHVAELREMHARTFKEVNDYFSEITSNNLETIRALKDEVYARKRTEAHNEKAMLEVAKRNKKLTEPLARLQRRKGELEAELIDYLANKESLQSVKSQVKETNQDYQKLTWEHEVLSQRYAKLVEDRDIILKKYNQMLQDIQRKATFRRVLLQKKLELVQSQLEGRDTKLTELLKQANMSEEDIRKLDQKVHDLLAEKDKTIENLRELLVRMTERCEDIVCTYEAYLQDKATTVKV